jgi:hypothetical protein
MPKDNGTGTSMRWGINGDHMAERLVGSPPGLSLAGSIQGRRDAAWKCCHLMAMALLLMTMVQIKTGGSE